MVRVRVRVYVICKVSCCYFVFRVETRVLRCCYGYKVVLVHLRSLVSLRKTGHLKWTRVATVGHMQVT